MNPLDLPGPEFLAFYLVVALVILAALLWLRVHHDPDGTTHARLTDPYRIAYLRGGAHEMLRVAALALVDRGLLRADGDTLVAVPGAAEVAVPPLERAILVHFARSRPARDVFDSPSLTALGLAHHDALGKQGLLPDQRVSRGRTRRALAAALLLVVLAGSKLVVALAGGHTNVLFLVGLAALSVYLVVKISHPRLTTRGQRVLDDLRLLFAGLRGRAGRIRPGGASQDALLLAAVYGVGTLASLPAFGYAQTLFPRATKPGDSSSSSCGTACGASCGGGGDGGGGCGGCGGD